MTLDNTWDFPARVVNIVDGDTLDVRVDAGFRITREVRLRLAEVDTAEIFGVPKDSEEYQRGATHRNYVTEWVEQGRTGLHEWPFIVVTDKQTGKYGRYIASILYRRVDDSELIEDLQNEFPEVADT